MWSVEQRPASPRNDLNVYGCDLRNLKGAYNMPA